MADFSDSAVEAVDVEPAPAPASRRRGVLVGEQLL
jgi:hypothetical protein